MEQVCLELFQVRQHFELSQKANPTGLQNPQFKIGRPLLMKKWRVPIDEQSKPKGAGDQSQVAHEFVGISGNSVTLIVHNNSRVDHDVLL